MRHSRFAWVLKGIAFVVLGGLAFGFLTMTLWNHLMPEIFGLKEITFWQAIGLLILSKLLVKGFGWHKGGCHRHGPGPGGPPWREHWRKRWEEKMANMTPEQREKLRQKWGDKCGPPWMRFNEEEQPKTEGTEQQ